MQERVEVIVKGRVQLVMFRDFTTRKARSLGLVGYVENLSDGTVHAIAEGERRSLEKWLDKLHDGSVLSRVDAVDAHWQSATGEFSKFTIKY